MPIIDNGDGTGDLNLNYEPVNLTNIPLSAISQVRPGVYEIDAQAIGGTEFLFGAGVPAADLGSDGTKYFQTDGPANWEKVGGSWVGPYPTGGGGTPPLSTVLSTGNTTGGSDIEVSAGDAIVSAGGSGLQLTASNNLMALGATKLISRAFAFFIARRVTSTQSFGSGSTVVLWNDEDTDNDAGFSYNPGTGVITVTEPQTPNEYNLNVNLNIQSADLVPQQFVLTVFVNGLPNGFQSLRVIDGSVASQSVQFYDRLRLGNGDTIWVQVDTLAGGAGSNEILLGSNISLRRTGDGT